MDDTETLHDALNTVEARSIDTALARMVRLRLAIAHATTDPGCPTTGINLEEHWLTLVHEPTGEEIVDRLERERLRTLLQHWLDAQRARQRPPVTDMPRTAPPRAGMRVALRLREPLHDDRGARQRWWRHFDRISPGVHTLGRELAHDGVIELNVGYLHATAIVEASSGGRYITVLRWPGGMPKVPHTVTPICSCPARRRWCKHAIAAAYHLIDRSWCQGATGGADGVQQMEKPPESARKR